MISKYFRLKESEVKKVLQSGKPFFSYGIVLNQKKNTALNNRFAIVIGGKSVEGSVERNFFRRRFYDTISKLIPKSETILNLEKQEKLDKNSLKNTDFVFVVKKQTKLDKNNLESIKGFDKDIGFLIKSMNLPQHKNLNK